MDDQRESPTRRPLHAGRARTPALAALLASAILAMMAPAALAVDPEVGEMTGDTASAIHSAASDNTCTDPALSNPLGAFDDWRHYYVAPGGQFEDRGASGWQLSGNAQYNNPASPWALFGGNNIESMRLQPGGSATSPVFCVDLDHPSFRFSLADFEARDGELDVEVIYPDVAQDNVFLSARLTAGKSWTLSPDVMLEPERGGSAPGWRKVAIRFTARGANADFHIDDLVIDPRLRA